MNEIFARLLFAAALFGLYLVGIKLSLIIKSDFMLNIEFKYILPIMTIVFLDYWIRAFSHYFCMLDLCYKSVNTSSLRLDFRFHYHGKKTIQFNMGPVENISGFDPVLIFENPLNNQSTNYPVPEKFSINVGANLPVFDFTILGTFRKEQKPSFRCFKHEWYIYRPVVFYEFGNRLKHKKILVLRHAKREE